MNLNNITSVDRRTSRGSFPLSPHPGNIPANQPVGDTGCLHWEISATTLVSIMAHILEEAEEQGRRMLCLGFLPTWQMLFALCFKLGGKLLSAESRILVSNWYTNAVILGTNCVAKAPVETILICYSRIFAPWNCPASFLTDSCPFHQNTQDKPNLKVKFTNVGMQKKMAKAYIKAIICYNEMVWKYLLSDYTDGDFVKRSHASLHIRRHNNS